MTEILALIPARGGSKGIPRKNLRPLAGKPLLIYTIEQALATAAVSRVVVSTDDDEIASVSRLTGAEVVRRPAELSGDEATSESALLHALDHLKQAEGYEPDRVVFLQATSPLRRGDDIARALAILEREGADSLFSACAAHGFLWRRRGDELSSLSYDYHRRPRRQELAGEDLMENGSIYVFKPEILRREGNRLGGKIAVHRMHPLDSLQVDEPRDLETLEHLLALRRGSSRAEPPPREELAAVRLLVLDFDGVMTDNRVLVDQDGREAVLCSRGDGMGLELVREAGLEVMVMSKEKNPVVAARCRKLGLPCQQGEDDKITALKALAAERGLDRGHIAYVGNDVNDLGPMSWVGLPVAVADAEPAVLSAARWITSRRGGHGAVREVCDCFLDARGG